VLPEHPFAGTPTAAPQGMPQSIEVVAPRTSFAPALMERMYRSRGTLVAPVIVAAAVTAWRSHARMIDVGIGSGVFLLGWAGRMWSQRHLGYRLRSRRMRLTTCGPYRWVRNPVYIANTLVVTGTTLMTGAYWLAAAAALLCGVVYSLAVRHEEAALGQWYGATHLAFVVDTPRWIPSRPSSRRRPCCTGARSWMHVALAEWHVPLVLVPVAIPLVLR